MDIIQITGIGIIATIVSVVLKKFGAEFAVMVSIVGGILIFFMIMPYLVSVLEVMRHLASNINTNIDHVITIFKILGIAYIAEFGAQVCKDAGEGAIASKIELGGKVIIMVMSTPIIVSFLNLVLSMTF